MSIHPDLDSILANLTKDQLCIVYSYSSNDRKIIHQYLSNKYPKLRKMSLYCSLFDGHRNVYIKKCYECGKWVNLKHYSYGPDKHNKGEYFYNSCDRCGEIITFHPNYDVINTDIKVIYGNNIIAIGNYITVGDLAHYTDNKDIDDIGYLRLNNDIYVIDRPTSILNKRNLSKYIADNIKL
ncbi:MAG: hypothetical protein Homavirus20_6 [Homavirus sp.]|uniref:Uncharacterized protein n=1 Tax=Homavirus sp. TaxID=2487769 RepID=A0A3G5A4T5_9VIRU|nr:MAG: hypothetical protein Homavirus20_6 [Homavirus sp.]